MKGLDLYILNMMYEENKNNENVNNIKGVLNKEPVPDKSKNVFDKMVTTMGVVVARTIKKSL